MDEVAFPFNTEELSAEDLRIIQAFDSMNDLVTSDYAEEQASQQSETATLSLDDISMGVETAEDMLIIFVSEADEDISSMRRALQQLEQDNQANSSSVISLGRSAHKLKGTSGAMGCEKLAAIAHQIEEILQLLKDGRIAFLTGLMTLVHAINALEVTLKSFVSDGEESSLPLQALLQALALLDVSEQGPSESMLVLHGNPQGSSLAPATTLSQVESQYLHALMAHTEHLIELRTPLQDAQKLVTKPLMELQAAHTRLRRLEGLFSSVAFTNASMSAPGQPSEEHRASSLVTRILHEALQRNGRPPQSRLPLVPSGASPDMVLWDEIEMDQFTESRILSQSFAEAVADVATASAQLRSAFVQLDSLIEQQIRQAILVRNDTLRLRSAPFSVLLVRIQREVQMIAQVSKQPIQFEVSGEATEIDQDILDLLGEPLLQLVRTSVEESLLAMTTLAPCRLWLQVQALGSEIAIELGFSMPVPGGAMESLRGLVRQLRGSMAARGNLTGGVTFQLRFPRSQGIVQGLLVQAGGQGVILPLPQIHLIDYKRQKPYMHLYHLSTLLGFPHTSDGMLDELPPVILLAGFQHDVAIQVDEIISEIELVTKPLSAHLQRPGIVGSAIDGAGNVLLVVDFPALIHVHVAQRRHSQEGRQRSSQPAKPPTLSGEEKQAIKVLVADDSVSIRQSLRQTFEHVGYRVTEARDGTDVLDYLSTEQIPDVLLLDIEMPNLNGYDLLNILHSQPAYADCKTILLTSRSSEKHRRLAMELGAYAFLSKPCPQEVLLETVRQAVAESQLSL